MIVDQLELAMEGRTVKRMVGGVEVSSDTFNDFVNFERLYVEHKTLEVLVSIEAALRSRS